MILSGYNPEQRLYFVTVGREENARGITGMGYSLHYYDKATGAIVLKKKRIIYADPIIYRNLMNEPEEEKARLEWI